MLDIISMITFLFIFIGLPMILIINGIDIRTIQELLGHVQIDTTEIYTHLHDQEVMDAMLDHPLSQFKMANALEYCA